MYPGASSHRGYGDVAEGSDMSPREQSRNEYLQMDLGLIPKKPVTVLQELLSRRGGAPKYELVQIEGAVHEPTFCYRVSFGDLVASGTGRSKKEAKHAAAKNILEKIIGSPEMEAEENNEVPAEPVPQVPSTEDEIVAGNPIGTLQEMCMARRWPPPTYEMTCEEGPPHEKLFTIACVVFNLREIGIGKSKKVAKREAAIKMWERLNENADFSKSEFFTETPDRSSTGYLRSAHHIANMLAGHNQRISRVSRLHRNLKDCSGDMLSSLHAMDHYLRSGKFDHSRFLREIADEQQFEITFMEIEERSVIGHYQCLVQLSTAPVAVCYGSGVTPNTAREAAAFHALEYLRIMTK